MAIKKRITLEKRILFIVQNLRLVVLTFSDKATTGIQPLIYRARQQLGYSKNTSDMQIHDAIYSTWCRMTGRKL